MLIFYVSVCVTEFDIERPWLATTKAEALKVHFSHTPGKAEALKVHFSHTLAIFADQGNSVSNPMTQPDTSPNKFLLILVQVM